MDDKRTALALFLCFVLVLFYTEVVLGPEMKRANLVHEHAQTQMADSSTPSGEKAPGNTNNNVTNLEQNPAPQAVRADGTNPQVSASHALQKLPSAEGLKNSQKTVVNLAKVSITINHLGARVSSYNLREYKNNLKDQQPLNLVADGGSNRLPVGVVIGAIDDAQVVYQLVKSSPGITASTLGFNVSALADFELEFRGELPGSGIITKRYIFTASPYLFKVLVEVSGREPEPLWLEWNHAYSTFELEDRLNPHYFTLINADAKLEQLALDPKAPEGLNDQGRAAWVSFSDMYFIAAILPGAVKENDPVPASQYIRIGRSGPLFVARMYGESTNRAAFSLYVGPKEPAYLVSAGQGLDRSRDLGIFTPISYPLLSLVRFFYSIFHNYGLAIILLTLAIKLLFLPLTKASLLSMQKMQELQPEMQALRERIKDATELNKAMLDLYKKRQVNPIGGCLPILIQIPVFFGLYNALLNAIELRHAPFAMWINDLSAPEALYFGAINIPVMLLLMAASMYVQMVTQPQMGDPMQQKIMKFMPIMFVVMFIIFPMPSGLVLYWLVNNLISIVQQAWLRNKLVGGPYWATIVASFAIFGIGYIITLI
jgi:YidC/Oxa1 family membrane protein insertase